MFRSSFVTLSILGLLLCPYRCASLGDGCGVQISCETQTSCGACCCNDESADETSSQQPRQSGGDDCDHECVIAKSTIPSVQRTPKEFVRSMVDFSSPIVVVPPEVVDVALIDPPHHCAYTSLGVRGDCGLDLRLMVASLLI